MSRYPYPDYDPHHDPRIEGYEQAVRDVVRRLRAKADYWQAVGSGAYAGAFRKAADDIAREFGVSS